MFDVQYIVSFLVKSIQILGHQKWSVKTTDPCKLIFDFRKKPKFDLVDISYTDKRCDPRLAHHLTVIFENR